MDALDKRIIEILQTDASIPLTKIATMLQVPKPTIYMRFNKLKDSGVIKGFNLVLGSAGEMPVHIAIIKVRNYLLSEMGPKTLGRLGEQIALRSDIIFTASISGNELIIAWKGDAFRPHDYPGVIEVKKLDSQIFKAP